MQAEALGEYGVTTGSAGGQGGGGTGGSGNTRNGGNGSANTGGGGGGGVVSFTAPNTGGTGGSGIVILRYATSDIASYTTTGITPTETTVGTDTILSFTTVGTGTITFTSPPPTGTISTGEMIFNSTTDKVEYWDGTKWYGITYEVAEESPYRLRFIVAGNMELRDAITGVGFEPDLIWVKNRSWSACKFNRFICFVDIVRGIDEVIHLNCFKVGQVCTSWSCKCYAYSFHIQMEIYNNR